VDIKLTVAAQPKNTVREFSFHLFPKLNIMEYYRTYSRLLLVLSLFLVVAGLVSIGVKWIEGNNQREKQLPKVNNIEKYTEPDPRPQNKKSKSRPAASSTGTFNKKQQAKLKSDGKNSLNEKLLMDSLKNELRKYLSRHSTDTMQK